MRTFVVVGALLFTTASFPGEAYAADQDAASKDGWIQLFNGKDLKDWRVKIRHHDLNDNFGNTFRVEDGLLKVRYDAYGESFNERFGHIHYKTPYSNYRFRVEYRFVGEQCQGGPGWATRNSGVMIHGEDPALMGKDQNFPVSIEVQLLGGNGTDLRTTSNLCTPGTNVVMNDELITDHCIGSKSKTYHGQQWVTAEIEVRGNKMIKHILDGEVVLEYHQPQLDDRKNNNVSEPGHVPELIANNGNSKLLTGGYISLQSESHPIDFRKVEIQLLPDEN